MIRNYIKTAIQSLKKNKAYSFLNIIGLAIGIACAALIFLWVEDEVSFDSANVKKDRLFLVRVNQKYDTYVFTHSSTPGLFGPSIQQDLPGIVNTCRASESMSFLFSKGDRSVFARGKYADPSIFSMFTLPFVEGNAASAFTQLRSLVITETAAKKFFGDDHNVIGKTIRVDNKQDYSITGVIKDLPANSTLQFEWLMPFKIYFDQNAGLQSWGQNWINTYVELGPDVSAETVNRNLYNYIQKHNPSAISHTFLFAMKDWHLFDEFKDGKLTGGGKIEYVHLFTFIAWIILLIACINFMNLATARSEKRAREVGVRKVLGAGKKMLIAQFIGEALFMSLIAAFIAVIVMLLALPEFNTLVQKQLAMGWFNPSHIVVLLLIALVCGIVAGSYPSLYLSSFNPVSVLKGIKMKDSAAALIRKLLVVMQFVISIVLIISTIVVYLQIQHVKNRQLGFNKDNLIEMPVQGQMAKNYTSIRQDLINTGAVSNVGMADYPIIYGGNNGSSATWDGKPTGSQVLISNRSVSADFFETVGLKILEGRNLALTDTASPFRIVITQSLEKIMGDGSAIGKIIRFEGDTITARVVGVVNNYVYGDMYGKPDPVMFFSVAPKDENVMNVSIKPQADIEKALSAIQVVMKRDNPAFPFDYRFVDDQFNQIFTSEMMVSKLSRVFATLAIIISCLGLFGLAAYTAERRTKEIGVRKVIGASVSAITGLLLKDFLRLVIISCFISFPIAYWIMYTWLNKYQYHIDIQLWVFLAAGLTAIVIAVATISFQSVKAAITNPIKCLRSE